MIKRMVLRNRSLFGIALVVVLLAALSFQLISSRLGERSGYPGKAWPTSTPEKQGMDSEKLAKGLAAMQEDGTPIHSLMIIRHDKVIVDAYFYPLEFVDLSKGASLTFEGWVKP